MSGRFPGGVVSLPDGRDRGGTDLMIPCYEWKIEDLTYHLCRPNRIRSSSVHSACSSRTAFRVPTGRV